MTGPAAAGVDAVVVDRLLGFARHLRRAGVPVGAEELMRSVRALDAVDLAEPDSLFWGLRVSMVRRQQDLATFDEAFERYWRGGPEAPPPRPGAEGPPGGDGEVETERARPGAEGVTRESSRAGGGEPEDSEPAGRAAWSDLEVAVDKDFEDYTDADHARLVELLARLAAGGPTRVSRRRRAHRRGAIDVRRTVRSGFRTEGSPLRQLRRRPQLRPRRMAFVCDVSGSMEHYSRAIVELAHVALRSRWPVEAFAFATQLTRITGQLRQADPQVAMSTAVETVVDWSGGTRVGACLEELNRRHRPAVQGAVVVVASDGWDLGEPARLAAEAELLHRMAHRVVWVNPHLKDPAFEPLTRGMSAALPHVDDLVSCHNFASFLALLELLESV